MSIPTWADLVKGRVINRRKFAGLEIEIRGKRKSLVKDQMDRILEIIEEATEKGMTTDHIKERIERSKIVCEVKSIKFSCKSGIYTIVI